MATVQWGHKTQQEAKQRLFLNHLTCLMKKKKKTSKTQGILLDAAESISKEISCLEKTTENTVVVVFVVFKGLIPTK